MKQKLHIFIDESGDLGKSGSKYFVIAALTTEAPKPIENAIKRIRTKKLKKKLKKLSEIKGNNSSPEIRKYVLKELIKHDCKFEIIAITKEKVKDYLYDKKHKLYNYIIGMLIEDMDIHAKDISLVIDKKDNNKLLKEDLNLYIKKKIEEKKFNFKIEISHKNSSDSRCLQAVDFIAWSVNRKLSFDDESYFKIIEPKVRTFKKLWNEK